MSSEKRLFKWINLCEKCERCNNQRKDYLEKLQTCNSCYKQMITLSGNKIVNDFIKSVLANNSITWKMEAMALCTTGTVHGLFP